jgi:hypothetical protein
MITRRSMLAMLVAAPVVGFLRPLLAKPRVGLGFVGHLNWWRGISATLLLLALVACDQRQKPTPPQEPAREQPDTVHYPEAPPVAAAAAPVVDSSAGMADTLYSRDSTALADTAYKIEWGGEVLRYIVLVDTTRERFVDSSIVVRYAPLALGIPNGPFYLPLETCRPAYTGTLLVADASLNANLGKARACSVRIVAAVPRKEFHNGKTASGADTGLSVAKARTFFNQKVDSAAVADAVRDGTFFAWYIGDDILGQQVGTENANEWGKAPMSVKLARWDSIAGIAKQRWPDAMTNLRALPTQLTGRVWKHLDAVQVQYGGPRRNGRIQDFIAAQVAAADSLKLGILLGLNPLDGGCGPPEVQPRAAADSARRCPPGVVGSRFYGTYTDTTVRRYMTSAQEVVYYKTALLKEPRSCGSIDWRWSPTFPTTRTSEQYLRVKAYHTRPDIIAANQQLAPLAKNRPATSCIHPDRR